MDVSEARFWSKVEKGDPDACWEWRSGRQSGGYGQFLVALTPVRRRVMAHRVAYQLATGPIPDGFEIDHLCNNPGCVNPRHLEAVTPQTNSLRSNNVGGINARKTHCPRGHDFSMEGGRRICVPCRNAARRIRRAAA